MSWQRIVFAAAWLPLSALIVAALVGAAIEITRIVEGARDRRKGQRGKA